MADKSFEYALIAAQGAEEARAADIIILDMRALTAICDYFVICHGRSVIHVCAVADKIEETMKRHNISLHHREGRVQASWIVLDYQDIVIHIFSKETREFYELERLWGDAPRCEFTPCPAVESD